MWGGSPFGCLDYLYLEGGCLGYFRVSVVFAGAHGVCFFFRQAQPGQIEKKWAF